jgi:hypothetical protein
MLKKIIIGVLLVSVLGAAGTALAYNTANPDSNAETTAIEPVASSRIDGANDQASQNGATQGAQTQAGAPFQEIGTISEINDFGFQFKLQNGETVYIELGPPDFWRNQGIELQVGQSATVVGSSLDGQIHADQVLLANGLTLQLRTETGQPLWSGGASAGQGQNGGQAAGEHQPQPQAQVDEWLTLEGELLAFQGSSMTLATAEGEIISFQTGQPRFFSDQGISFQVGDSLSVVGFYENGQFMVGDITQTSTGLRVLLRDPNGRPLWAGPGNGLGNQGSGAGRGQH